MVIQVHGSNIATSEERVAHWKILVNQWSNAHAFRDELSHHLVFTKTTKSRPPLPQWGIPPTREGPLSNAQTHLPPEAGAKRRL
jgi:hypothetical protein